VKAAAMRIRTRLVSAEALRKESATGEAYYVLSVNGVEIEDGRWYPDESPEQAKTTIECACFATSNYSLFGITVARLERGAKGKERRQQSESCEGSSDATSADSGTTGVVEEGVKIPRGVPAPACIQYRTALNTGCRLGLPRDNGGRCETGRLCPDWCFPNYRSGGCP